MRWARVSAWLSVLATASGSGAAGPFGSDTNGIRWDAPEIRGWASACVEYVQPDAASGGYARDDSGAACDPAAAVLGRPEAFTGAQTRHVLSLGNGGSITLSFEHPIENRPGPDFAVFENGFAVLTDWTGTSREGSMSAYTFAELAFVEVATRTSAWARLPTTCLNTAVLFALDHLEENRFASQDVTLLDGFAGQHAIEYGTPFNLDALTNHPAVLGGEVDLRNIRYVRLVDVVGDGSTTDSEGRPVYDPFYHHQDGYPLPAPASAADGFDLRGVAVLNFAGCRLVLAEGQGVCVSWYAATGFSYRVEGADRPGGAWTEAGAAVDGDDTERVVPVGTSPSGVYRVRRTAQPGGGP